MRKQSRERPNEMVEEMEEMEEVRGGNQEKLIQANLPFRTEIAR